MTQIFSGSGLGYGASFSLKGSNSTRNAQLGQGGLGVFMNVANGNLWLKQSDGFMSAASRPIFENYNSQALGHAWRFNVESQLIRESDTRMGRIGEDGHLRHFSWNAGEQAFVAEDGSLTHLRFHEGFWEYREAGSRGVSRYDRAGQLQNIEGADGHALCFYYEAGQLSVIEDRQSGSCLRMCFEDGVLSHLRFEEGEELLWERNFYYDGLGRLCRVRQDLGAGADYEIRYHYLGDSQLLDGIEQFDGTSLTIRYDAMGRVSALVDGEGRGSFYRYGDKVTWVSNELGETWTYYYDNFERITGMDGPLGYTCRYRYEGHHLQWMQEGLESCSFVYDEAGDCVESQSSLGKHISRVFDAAHRLLSERSSRGSVFLGEKRWIYNAQGLLRFEVGLDNRVWEMRYDAQGLVVSKRCYLGELWSGEDYGLEALEAWAFCQVQDKILLQGYRYDWRGNLQSETRYSQVNTLGEGIEAGAVRHYYVFDAYGRLREKTGLVDGRWQSCFYLYDSLGRLIQSKGPGEDTRIDYDDAHQRMTRTLVSGLQCVDILDKSGLVIASQKLSAEQNYGTTTYEYDKDGRLVAETNSRLQKRHFFYDKAGQRLAEIGYDGRVSSFEYSASGQLLRRIAYEETVDWKKAATRSWDALRPHDCAQDRISHCLYNELGQWVYEVNALGAVTHFVYDADNRVIQKTQLATRVAPGRGTPSLESLEALSLKSTDRRQHYYYDAEGRLVGEINGEGRATGYTFDVEGHLVARRQYEKTSLEPISGQWSLDAPAESSHDIVERHLYNAAGLKIADIDADNYLTEYRYNTEGQLVESCAYYNSLQTEGQSPVPHLNDRRLSYRYNAAGQCIEEKSSQGWTRHWGYTASGQVERVSLCDDKTQVRSQYQRYDALGRLTHSLDAEACALLDTHPEEVQRIWDEKATRYDYDALGHVICKTDALGHSTHFYYNEAGLLRFTLGASGSISEQAYNDFNEVIRKTRYVACWVGQSPESCSDLERYTALVGDSRLDESHFFEYNQAGLVRQEIQGNRQRRLEYNAFSEVEAEWGIHGLTQFEYDRRGLEIHRTEDVGGLNRNTTHEYDAFGRLVKTHRAGRAELRVFDKRGHVIGEEGVSGTRTLSYDAFSRVIEVKGLKTERYSYDDSCNSLILETAYAKTLTLLNAFGETISLDVNGHKTCFEWNAQGKMVLQVIGDSRTRYEYDAEGQLLLEDKNGLISRYRYDTEGHLLEKTLDPEGLALTSHYRYDGMGRRLEVYENAMTTHYTFDRMGNLVLQCIDPEGLALKTEFVYNEQGLLTRKTQKNPQGLDAVWSYTWDALGQCLSLSRDPDGLALKTEYRYDDVGNRILEINARGFQTRYCFDAHNQLRFSIDARGAVTGYEYDAHQNKSKSIRYAHALPVGAYLNEADILQALVPDQNDQVSTFGYDAANRLIARYDAKGHGCTYAYDAQDNLIEKRILAQKDPSSDDRITRYAYDALHRMTLQLEPNGCLQGFRYDALGHCIQKTRYATACSRLEAPISSTLDAQHHYYYDKGSRLIAEVNTLGYATVYGYDALGHRTSSTRCANPIPEACLAQDNWPALIKPSALDRKSQFVFDALGHEVARISPEGRCIKRSYDALGNVLSESNETKTSFVFDAIGRLKSKTDAASHSTSYTYDEADNVVSRRDAKGQVWHYRYNENNQCIESLSPELAVSRYDKGKLLTETRAVKQTRAYDCFGNMTCEISDADFSAKRVYYRYDANNRKIATIYPDRQVAIEGQSSLARLEKTQTLTETSSLNAFGECVASTDKSGLTRHFAYDLAGHLTYSLDANQALTQYHYDLLGNCLQKTRFAEAHASFDVHPSVHDRHDYYRYDKAQRLIESRKDLVRAYDPKTRTYYQEAPCTQWTYNAFDELSLESTRVSKTQWADTRHEYTTDGLESLRTDPEGYVTSYTYNNAGLKTEEHQYAEKDLSPSARDRLLTFEYDSLGQCTAKVIKNAVYQRLTPNGRAYENLQGNLRHSYTYDALGRLVETQDPLGNSARLEYDAENHIIAKIGALQNGKRPATRYAFDAQGLLLETRQWAEGSVGTQSPKDIVQRNHYDNSGNLILQEDGLQQAVYFSYDARGNLLRRWQSITQIDGSTFLQDKRYRYDNENHLIESATFKSNGLKVTENSTYNLFGELASQGLNAAKTFRYEYDLTGNLWRSNAHGFYQIYLYDLDAHCTQTIQVSSAFVPENQVDLSAQSWAGTQDFDAGTLHRLLQHEDQRYDARGYLLGTSQQRISSLTESLFSSSQTVDRWGNVLQSTNARGMTTTYEYNVFNTVSRQILPYHDAVDALGLSYRLQPILSFAVDALGRRIACKDALGHVTTMLLDANGNILTETDARGSQRKKYYNSLGQLETSTHERGFVTRYVYDANNRLIAVQAPNTAQYYRLNAEGQIIEQKDAQGNQIQSWYNAQGQETRRQSTDGVRTYAYDDANHKTMESRAGDAQSWSYDAFGKLIEHIDLAGRKNVYLYDKNGLLVKESSSIGKTKHYYYYSDGKLLQYHDAITGEVLNYNYDAEGNTRFKESSRANVWEVERDYYEYDAENRLLHVRRNDARGAQILAFDYQYDLQGNIRSTKAQTPLSSHSNYFVYDENNRLTFDKAQLYSNGIGISPNQGSILAYDEAGNLTSVTKYEYGAWTVFTYQYDAENRLEIVSKNGTTLQRKFYDDGGNVYRENYYNLHGSLSQWIRMFYSGNRMYSAYTYNASDAIIVSTGYYYDNVGNLSKSQTFLLNVGPTVCQTHTYSYAGWDSYQQTSDTATSVVLSTGRGSTYSTTQSYDVNGQLLCSQHDVRHQTQYLTSSLEGIRRRIEGNDTQDYLNFAGRTQAILKTQKTRYRKDITLDVFSGFDAKGRGAFGSNIDIPATSPQDTLGSYTVQAGDRLESIAYRIYGDTSLWYLIADANGINDKNAYAGELGGSLRPGQSLKIPPAFQARYSHQTQSLLKDRQWLGNIAAHTSIPQSKTHSSWSFFSKLIVSIVSVFATVISAGALGVLAGGTCSGFGGLVHLGMQVLNGASASLGVSAAMSFSAGFLGSISAQGMANLLSLQKGMDFKGALFTGLGAAASSAMGHLVQGNPKYQDLMSKLKEKSLDFFQLDTAVNALERETLSQSIGGALQHKSINWLDIAISSAAAGFAAGTEGENTKEFLDKTFGKSAPILESQLLAIGQGFAQGEFNAAKIIEENLGNSIANALLPSEVEEQALAAEIDAEIAQNNAIEEGSKGAVLSVIGETLTQGSLYYSNSGELLGVAGHFLTEHHGLRYPGQGALIEQVPFSIPIDNTLHLSNFDHLSENTDILYDNRIDRSPAIGQGMSRFSELLSLDQLQQMFPRAKTALLTDYLGELNEQLPLAGIDTPKRLAYFFATVNVETAGMTDMEENNFRFKEANARANFGRTFRNVTSEQFKALGTGEKFANFIYAHKNGNGNVDSGDGYRFRGRGLFHITGRGNYLRYGSKELRDNPELMASVHNSVKASVNFWKINKLAGFTDNLRDNIKLVFNAKVKSMEVKDRSFEDLVVKVNGGKNGLLQRAIAYNRFIPIFQ